MDEKPHMQPDWREVDMDRVELLIQLRPDGLARKIVEEADARAMELIRNSPDMVDILDAYRDYRAARPLAFAIVAETLDLDDDLIGWSFAEEVNYPLVHLGCRSAIQKHLAALDAP